MKSLFHFGETVDGYDTRVLNEREARSASGILFTFALISFFYAFVIGDFFRIKIFVSAFLIDFIIRVLINPSYAPTMILGRLFTSHQTVEYVGAPQKRFARALGLILAVIMFILIVVLNTASPINFIICGLCLTFLFFETVFGICLGCRVYNTFTKHTAKNCPGGVCEIHQKEPIQYISTTHAIILGLFVAGVILLPTIMPNVPIQALMSSKDCIVPDWAISIGHEELWLEHNGCTDTTQTSGEQIEPIPTSAEVMGIDDPCTNIPEGHPEDLWLIHNGCFD